MPGLLRFKGGPWNGLDRDSDVSLYLDIHFIRVPGEGGVYIEDLHSDSHKRIFDWRDD